MLPAALLALAYVIGSIPFSFLVVKLFSGKDVREHGSRNVGATNVARTAGKLPGIIALILDVAKGYVAIEIGRWVVGRPEWPLEGTRDLWIALAGLVAVVAHMFPVWLRFHGGKGVATAAGVFLALDWRVAAASAIVFAIVVILSRYVSLASIVSAASVPLFFRFLVPGAPFWRIIVSIGIALAVILKHHENIKRLAQGAERKTGRKKDQ